jgi:hypothetical protein
LRGGRGVYKYDEPDDAEESFGGGENLPFVCFEVWLEDEAFEVLEEALLTREVEAPFVFSHLVFLHEPLRAEDASRVADDDVEDDMVPPALL